MLRLFTHILLYLHRIIDLGMEQLKQFGIIPIDFNVLSSTLESYRSIADKVYRLEKDGSLIRLKKGMFVVSPTITHQTLSRELISNHLYGPSYISLESALSFYKLIPEQVYTVRSVTTKRAHKFRNEIGNFEYITVPETYYSIGIRQEIVSNQYAYLIATPEKALCDIIMATRGFRIQSVRAMRLFLEQDLRIDFSVINTFDLDIIKNCASTGKKVNELNFLLKILENE